MEAGAFPEPPWGHSPCRAPGQPSQRQALSLQCFCTPARVVPRSRVLCHITAQPRPHKEQTGCSLAVCPVPRPPSPTCFPPQLRGRAHLCPSAGDSGAMVINVPMTVLRKQGFLLAPFPKPSVLVRTRPPWHRLLRAGTCLLFVTQERRACEDERGQE